MKKIMRAFDYVTVAWLYVLCLAGMVFTVTWLFVGVMAVLGMVENINYAGPRISPNGIYFTVLCLLWFGYRQKTAAHFKG